jgi:hypothetical protein
LRDFSLSFSILQTAETNRRCTNQQKTVILNKIEDRTGKPAAFRTEKPCGKQRAFDAIAKARTERRTG